MLKVAERSRKTGINIVNYCSAKKKVRELADIRFSGVENRTEERSSKLQTEQEMKTFQCVQEENRGRS